MKTLIKNGKVIDPATKKDGFYDLLINDGIIESVSNGIEENDARIIDATGCFIMPGFIDMHVHLRDPGQTYKETIQTGVKAAAKGGFTTIAAMPNTTPSADCVEVIDYVHDKAAKLGNINVLQIGAVTKGQQGKELSDIEDMVKHHIPAISEDGKSVIDVGIYRQALKIASKCNIPVLSHCEEKSLVNGGVMNDDDNAKRFGLPGISNAVEDIIVARDIILGAETNTHIHICHCSTKGSADIVRAAKKKGLDVTAEVCPHHFSLTSDDITSDDANFKMNPPLRTKEDKEALIKALSDDVIEVIATDHAPHHKDEKSGSMINAPFGIIGLETALSLTVTNLLNTNKITPMQMAEKMSYNPAKIMHLNKGSLAPKMPADIVIFNPEEEYTVDSNNFVSMGKNTPFNGYKLKGVVKYTIANGIIEYSYKGDLND